ncbi:TonB-dependent receptor [Aerophototrophica crusticola]|uniref:TonB-dependent receptor n=1 Tax=Aerophototrophica crusticola TaxID=1709002 RepID=UPI00384C344E
MLGIVSTRRNHVRRLPAFAGTLLLGTALVPLAPSPAALAQEGQPVMLEEVIVTARKRAEALEDVPFSINALSANQIQERGAVNLEDVARNIPSVTIQNLGPGQSQVAIRGISAGQIVRDQPGVKEQVGVYLDESVISLSLFTPDLDLYDLERVEVLRGPQGTLYGSGSLSGTIRYITGKPDTSGNSGSAELDVNMVEKGEVGYGARGMANVAISEQAALRAVAYHTAYPGFINAVQPDGSIDKDVNDGERTGGRVSLLFQPTEALSLTPRVVYQKVEADGFNRQDIFNILANDLAPAPDRLFQFDELQQYRQLEEKFEDEFYLVDLTASYDFGPVVLTSITSYTDRQILVRRDATQLTGSITGQPGSFDPAGFPRSIYGISSPWTTPRTWRSSPRRRGWRPAATGPSSG